MGQVVSTLKRSYPARLIYLAAAYFLWSMIDITTTVIALNYGGIEANPILASTGSWWIVLKALVVVSVIVWAVMRYKHKLLWYANIVTGGVVIWNILKIGELYG